MVSRTKGTNNKYQGHDNPYDLGVEHGLNDIGVWHKYHPDMPLTPEEFKDYIKGYESTRTTHKEVD